MPIPAFVAIPDLNLAPDAKILSVDAIALRDNPLAIAGAGAGAPQIVTAALADGAVTPIKTQFIKFLVGSRANTLADLDVVLDNTMNWRDRMVDFWGTVMMGTTSNIAAVAPGGSEDDHIGNLWTPPNTPIAQIVGDWMYTSSGGATRSVIPYLTYLGSGALNNPICIIWVRSTDGALMMNVHMADEVSSVRNLQYYFRVICSADLGGY